MSVFDINNGAADSLVVLGLMLIALSKDKYYLCVFHHTNFALVWKLDESLVIYLTVQQRTPVWTFRTCR